MKSSRQKNYIGLATSPHDPAIAIVNEQGQIVFAEAAERYLQNKRAWCSPPDDFLRIERLLKQHCTPGSDLVIGVGWRKKFFKQLRFVMLGPLGRLIKNKIGDRNFNLFKACVVYANTNHGVNTESHYKNHFPKAKVIRKSYDHHLSHAAAACYSSPYEEALCVVIDGFGENTNSSVFHYKKKQFFKLSKKNSSGSLGEFYSLLCDLVGFDATRGEEWKVMGLAAYGQFNKEYYDLLSQLIVVDDLRILNCKNKAKVERKLHQFRRKTGEPIVKYADLAFTGQYVFSELVNQLLNNLSQKNISSSLVLAGGCALNSAYVGTIPSTTSFSESYVFCAPADDGNAVGAALLAYYEDNPGKDYKKQNQIQSPYLGTHVDSKKVELLTKFSGLKSIELPDNKSLFQYVAEQISEGKIVGWMRGAAEFGPRALGNRSILADPRRKDIKSIINAKIKFREEFRPFAPAILSEFGEQYFDDYVETPYMERALKFKREVIDQVPGVVHEDGTGRLQSVKQEWNEGFYTLIKAFYNITGVPILLNTSFNVMGKPIVHSVEDAVSVFFTSGIDILVLEDTIFTKGVLEGEGQPTAQKTEALSMAGH